MVEMSAQDAINKLQYEEAKIKAIEEQIAQMNAVMTETRAAKFAIDNLPKKKTNAMQPVGAGIFVPGEVSGEDTVAINIGAGVVVEKTREEADELLAKRMGNIEEQINRLATTGANIGQDIMKLRKVIGEYMQRQQGKQPDMPVIS